MEKPCPICGDKMVLRAGKATGKEFWGCVNYFHNGCPGKRDLDGRVFGTDGEYPFSLGPDGETMFDACMADPSMTYEEAQEIAEAWEHDEENDPYK